MGRSETTRLLPTKHHSFKRVQSRYSLIAANGGFVEGYSVGVVTSIMAMPYFRSYFFNDETSDYYSSMLFSSYLLTAMVGSFHSGYFCDRLGRKSSIVLATALMFAGTFLQTTGIHVYQLLVGRMVSGFGGGLIATIVPVYQAEVATVDNRGSSISSYVLMNAFGQVIGFLWSLITSHIDSNLSWRIPNMCGCLFSVCYMLSLQYIPSSPVWLIHRGRSREALKILSQIYNCPEEYAIIQKEYQSMEKSICVERSVGRSTEYSDLFKGTDLIRLIYASFISVATCLGGDYVLVFYAPQIFNYAGFSGASTPIALTAGLGSLSFCMATLGFKYWVDSMKRRTLLWIGSSITAVCMLIIGCMFYFYSSIQEGEMMITNIYASVIVIFCIFLQFIARTGTWQIVSYVYILELLSVNGRSKGMSLSVGCYWTVSILLVYSAPYMLSYTVAGVYAFFALCSVFISIGLLFLPETRGKSHDEIDKMFD
ncbi:general substrate transporter [Pilobolus umbonatus]|nr:general substrate transporter [Pilobolus umbonatus]